MHKLRTRILGSIALISATIGSTGVTPAGAADPATLTVTTTSTVLGGPGCSLPEAILVANADASTVANPNGDGTVIATECSPGVGDDVIHLTPGATYSFSSILDDDHNEMGPTATPVVRSNIIIEGQGAILQHAGSVPFRAFAVGANGHLDLREVEVRGFSARGGNGGNGGGGGLGAGGAIYVHDGSLLVQWSTFVGNHAVGGDGGDRSTGIGGLGGGGGGGLGGHGGYDAGGGGGARGSGGASDLFGGGGGGGGTLSRGDDGGFDGGAGGHRCGGEGGTGDSLSVDDDGEGGTCEGGGGGGGGDQTFSSGDGGAGAYGGGGGGGAYDDGDGGAGGFGGGGGGATVEVVDGCGDCGGSGGDGGFGGGAGAGPGGFVLGGPGSPGTFGGSASGRNGGGGGGLGGAIFGHSSVVEVRNSTFNGNYVVRGVGGGTGATNGADAGGAIFTVAGSLIVRSSTIAGNESTGSGAGVVVYKPTTGEATSLNLRNTIVAGNTGVDECYVRNSPTVSGATNLITSPGVDTLAPCPGITTTTWPDLGGLALNAPGRTRTMALGAASSALDVGTVDPVILDDQRGIARPQGALPDIGAYEFEAATDPADVLPPTAAPTQSPAANGAGWNNTDVTVTWAWADDAGGSGIDATDCTTSSTSTGEGSALALGATCADLAGNSGSSSYTVKVDKTAPGVVCGTTPTYVIGSTPSTGLTATVTDGLSGPLASPVSAAVSAADAATAGGGTKPLTGSDVAGSSTTVSCPYKVGYQFLGFSKPPAGTTLKRGSAVPVTFRLGTAAGTPISDADAAALLTPTCRAEVTFDGAVVGCAKYDASTDSFQYEVKTAKNLAPGPHTIGIRVTAGGTVVNTDSMPITIR